MHCKWLGTDYWVPNIKLFLCNIQMHYMNQWKNIWFLCVKYVLLNSGTVLLFSQGHSAEIISLSFNSTGTQLITGSFDHTVSVWDINSGK